MLSSGGVEPRAGNKRVMTRLDRLPWLRGEPPREMAPSTLAALSACLLAAGHVVPLLIAVGVIAVDGPERLLSVAALGLLPSAALIAVGCQVAAAAEAHGVLVAVAAGALLCLSLALGGNPWALALLLLVYCPAAWMRFGRHAM